MISVPDEGRLSVPVTSSLLLSMTIFSTELSSKRPALMEVRPLPILTSFTPVVEPKAAEPTEVTESGITKVSGSVPT